MKQRSISKIFFKMPYELNESERKTQALLLIPFGLIFGFIFSYVWFGIIMGTNFIPLFLAVCLITAGVVSVLYYWDKLDKKYGMKPINSSFQLSYQGYVIILLCWAPTFFFMMLELGFNSGNLWFGLGGALALVYPILGMFLRIKTFSDDKIVFSRKVVLPNVNRSRPSRIPKAALPNIKGNLPSGDRKVTETIRGFGFMPVAYWTLSALLGLYITGGGFSDIYLHFAKGFPSLEAAVFTIILGLLVQSVYLFPDKLNKVVPIELRSKNGFWFMAALVFVLFGVSQFVIGVVTGLTA